MSGVSFPGEAPSTIVFYRYIWTGRKTDRQTDRQMAYSTDRKTDRQLANNDRQTDGIYGQTERWHILTDRWHNDRQTDDIY